MTELSASQRRKLQEVADGMLKIYRTLIRMQYLNPKSLHEGPHDIIALIPLCKKLDIDESIVYLYSILPYVVDSESWMQEFFQGGRFADFRDKDTIREGRNPMYDDLEEVEEDAKSGMPPWTTPLSVLGNHESVIIYNAKEHVIGILDHESCGSSDRNINQGFVPMIEVDGELVDGPPEAGSSDGEDSDDEGSDGDEKSEGSGKHDDESDENEEDSEVEEERWIYDEMASRPARRVLRDINGWFEDLSEIPEQGIEPSVSKAIYLKIGWPGDNFDVERLQIDRERASAAASAAYDLKENDLDAKVAAAQSWADYRSELDPRELETLQKRIEMAETEDEMWLAKWELKCAEDVQNSHAKRLQQVLQARKDAGVDYQYNRPEDQILGEVQHLQQELWLRQRSIEKLRDNPEEGKDVESLEKSLEITKKAFDAANVDLRKICPGRFPSFGRGVKETGLDLDERVAILSASVKEFQDMINPLRDWYDSIPETATKARATAEGAIRRNEDYIKSFTATIQHCEASLQEIEDATSQVSA